MFLSRVGARPGEQPQCVVGKPKKKIKKDEEKWEKIGGGRKECKFQRALEVTRAKSHAWGKEGIKMAIRVGDSQTLGR